MLTTMPEKVYLKTFDGFDMYKNGQMIYFASAKAKELLAYLVDRQGRYVTLWQLAETLFEDENDKMKAKKLVHTAYNRLTKTLVNNEIGHILKKGRGVYAIDCSYVICDSYEMQAHTQGASNYFLGEYMPEYSWAEVTLSNLIQEYYSQNQKSDSLGCLVGKTGDEAVGLTAGAQGGGGINSITNITKKCH